jgi:hypothetical protein
VTYPGTQRGTQGPVLAQVLAIRYALARRSRRSKSRAA